MAKVRGSKKDAEAKTFKNIFFTMKIKNPPGETNELLSLTNGLLKELRLHEDNILGGPQCKHKKSTAEKRKEPKNQQDKGHSGKKDLENVNPENISLYTVLSAYKKVILKELQSIKKSKMRSKSQEDLVRQFDVCKENFRNAMELVEKICGSYKISRKEKGMIKDQISKSFQKDVPASTCQSKYVVLSCLKEMTGKLKRFRHVHWGPKKVSCHCKCSLKQEQHVHANVGDLKVTINFLYVQFQEDEDDFEAKCDGNGEGVVAELSRTKDRLSFRRGSTSGLSSRTTLDTVQAALRRLTEEKEAGKGNVPINSSCLATKSEMPSSTLIKSAPCKPPFVLPKVTEFSNQEYSEQSYSSDRPAFSDKLGKKVAFIPQTFCESGSTTEDTPNTKTKERRHSGRSEKNSVVGGEGKPKFWDVYRPSLSSLPREEEEIQEQPPGDTVRESTSNRCLALWKPAKRAVPPRRPEATFLRRKPAFTRCWSALRRESFLRAPIPIGFALPAPRIPSPFNLKPRIFSSKATESYPSQFA